MSETNGIVPAGTKDFMTTGSKANGSESSVCLPVREYTIRHGNISDNCKDAMQYNLMKYKLASYALGIAHWDVVIIGGNPLHPGNTFTWSPELRQMLGFTEKTDYPDTFNNWLRHIHPDDREQALTAYAAHAADRTGKTPFDTQLRLRMQNGDYIHVRTFGATLRDEAGCPLRVAGALEDITGQKRTRDQLRETEERMQIMLDLAPFSLTMWDKNCNIIDCSRYTVDTLGFHSKQELLERVKSCMPEYQPNGRRSSDMLEQEAAKAFATGYNRLEWTQLTANGEPIIFDIPMFRVKYKGDYVLILYGRDIREDKKMLADIARRDEKLLAQTHWYKSLLDGIRMPISVTDADTNIVFTNKAAENIFGRSRKELIGRPCSIWNCPICNTADCSVIRAKAGFKQTFFKHNGLSFKVDTEIIKNLSGKVSGYLEVLQDITLIENVARQQADAANEAKTAFLAHMSHEMRTPLSAVISLSELLLENGGMSPDNEAYIDKIYNAGSTLLSIVNDILDISKIEAGKIEILPQEYEVPRLINDAVAQNILKIHSKPVRFVLNIGENAPARLYGDDIRVKQILSNLLSNAFKYTDEGSVELDVDYERSGDAVWTTFRVSDTGIGIRAGDLGRLFTDYTRLDETVSRNINGTGLGLSITKRLTELMAGSITVESEYGKGSVFTAKFRQQYVSDAVIGSETALRLKNFHYTAGKRHNGARLNRVRLPYARVLTVDDNLTNLDIARGLMAPYGMSVDCVTGGQAAIDALRGQEKKYDAVFMDHMMPEMDGIEAVRIIREEIGSEYAKTVPIIALTANAVTGSREKFLSKGFDAFISKPIDIFQLDSVIRRYIWNKYKEILPENLPGFADKRKKPDRRSGNERRVTDRRNASRPAPENMDGLDWAKGVERFGGEEAFRRILRSYTVNTQPLLDTISEVSAASLTQYAITVHGIKSSSRGIYAGKLGDLAETLEHAAKAGNLALVTLNNPPFLQMARKLIADIEKLPDKDAEAGVKPLKSRPDNMELTKLRAACDRYCIDGIETVMREIDKYEYTDDNGLVQWLRDNITRLNYGQICGRLTMEIEVDTHG